MNELVIEKRHNPVLDLSIAYGLFYIFEFNEIKATLHNYKSAYVIRHKSFDSDELDLDSPNHELYQFGDLQQKRDKDKMFERLFDDINPDGVSILLEDGVFDGIINYYSTEVAERNIKSLPNNIHKNDTIVGFGSWYGVRGLRGNGVSTKSHKIPKFEKWLGELGFLMGCSFANIEKKDFIYWMAIPSIKGVKKVERFSNITFNEETQKKELKDLTFANSVEIAITLNRLQIQEKMRTSNIRDNYSGVLFMRAWPNGHTASVDKVNTYNWLNFSDETLSNLIRRLQDTRKVSTDIQHSLSTWLTHSNKNTFHSYVYELMKSKTLISNIEREDYLNMHDLIELHHNIGVAKLGSRLKSLIINNKGHNLLNDLMVVNTKRELMEVISNLSIAFSKLYNKPVTTWNEKEYSFFLQVLENDEYSAKDIASAIMLHSNTYTI